jgi:predicted nucleic-acid-binding protein
MRAVDTKVVVRLLMGDEATQTAVSDRLIEKGAWVSILAVAETTWVLRTVYERSAADIAAAVEMLLGHELLVLQDSDAVAGALELYRSRPALGFSECLMLHIARKAGHLPMGTFDRALGRVEGAQKLST